MRNYKTFLWAWVLVFATCTTALGQIGLASYYSDEFQGAKTASGERYHKDAMTAGHKELAFGTYVRVTRLDTKKSVVVRINDRGPFYDSMVIDLSSAAAKKLGIHQEGKVEVRVDVVEKPAAALPEVPTVDPSPKPAAEKPSPKKEVSQKPPTPKVAKAESPKPKPPTPKPTPKVKKEPSPKPEKKFTPKNIPSEYKTVAGDYKTYDLYKIELKRPRKEGFGVQVASLSSYESAVKHVAKLQGKWFDNILLSIEPGTDKPKYKVILGPFEDRATASNYMKSAKKRYKVSGFVVDLSSLKYK